ncbi:MAG: serine/threonine protein kinase [Burkholderiaceae bacterium]
MSTPPDDDRTQLHVIAKADSTNAAPAPEQDRNALPVGARVLEFEIRRLIGVGGFGIVYLAYDHSLERHIALKEYMPSSLAERTSQSHVAVRSERHADTFDAGMRSFINEARLLARFDHPSLVKVYRFWEGNGTAYMVMPFYEGLTLKQTLQAMPAPPDEAWLKLLLAPLLDALDIIHQEKCFHRDIAPDNILMLADGRPLLLDFGAARRAITGMDQAFTVILKPGYAPIEQYAEVATLQQGAWTDLYALASVVFFAINGRPPTPSVTRMVSDAQVPLAQSANGRYSADFLQVIDGALAVKPDDRPQSVAALRTQLHLLAHQNTQHVASSPGPMSTPVANSGQARQSMSSSRKLAVGAATVLVIAAAGFWISRPAEVATPEMPAAERTTIVPANMAPVAAPQVQVAAARPATPVDATAILGQIYAARDPDHAVSVALPASEVHIGERLTMAVTSAQAGYVYLLMVGTEGTDFVLLFPNADDTDNRISANQPLLLPRKKWHMTASGPVGTDRFVVIVSDLPRQFNDAGLRKGSLFADFPIGLITQSAAVASGVMPVFAGKADCARAPALPCTDRYGAARFEIVELAAKNR